MRAWDRRGRTFVATKYGLVEIVRRDDGLLIVTNCPDFFDLVFGKRMDTPRTFRNNSSKLRRNFPDNYEVMDLVSQMASHHATWSQGMNVLPKWLRHECYNDENG